MDIRTPQIYAPQHQKMERSASDFISGIRVRLHLIEHRKKTGEVVRIFFGGVFGVMRVVRISPAGDDFLSIACRREDGSQHEIVAPVSQCAFMFSILTPAAGDPPEERVILGFAESRLPAQQAT